MANFEYKARDRSGQVVSGAIDATDMVELRRLLRSNDLYLIQASGSRVAETPLQANKNSDFNILEPRPKLEDMTIALRQLASMVKAGMPVIEAIEIVGTQTNKPPLRRAFAEIETRVNEGQTISSGMKLYPKIFNPLIVALTEAGEIAGTLESTLEVAAEQTDREDALKRRVSAAVLYPKIVVAAACGTIAGMLILVVPVFAQIYTQAKSKLPTPTLLLMDMSAFVVKFWWLILIGFLVAGWTYRQAKLNPEGKRVLDKIAIRLPIFGPLNRKIAIARFVLTLAGAMRGGVNVLSSMVISGHTAGNAVITDAVINASEAVRDGSTIGRELDKSGEFPLMVTKMISAGESTGNVDEMLEEINRFYERDVEHAVDKMTRMLEPAMTVMVGGIVLFVLLALYMPIFMLSETVLKSGK